MPTETVRLTGSALTGIAPHHLTAQLPQAVRLGRLRRKAAPSCLRLGAYFDIVRQTTPVPDVVDWWSKATVSISRMYLNDTYGCCVIAGKAHALGVTSANDTDSGGVILASDDEILSQYHGICGPGDNGCVITDVLDVMRSRGFLAGGKYYKIDGYVAVDWTNRPLVEAATYLFGCPTIGINLPQAWTENAIWDVTNSPIVGGHDVTIVGKNPTGVQVSSWGRVYTITWNAFLSQRWLEECYAVMYQSWYNSDRLAPCGVDVATLSDDLQKLHSGIVPDIGPTPTPTPPPPPPPAPQPVVPTAAEVKDAIDHGVANSLNRAYARFTRPLARPLAVLTAADQELTKELHQVVDDLFKT